MRVHAWIALALVGCASAGHGATGDDAGSDNGSHATADLTVTVVGSGTVTSSPAGITCGATCDVSFPVGTQVTLTATPATGGSFVGWSTSPCSGPGGCTFTITSATAVTAEFGCATGTQTFNFTGAPQTFTQPACVKQITVDVQGAAGGASSTAGAAGLGGRVQATLAIQSTDVITVFVGGVGGTAPASIAGTAGFNGGAAGNTNAAQAGGGGGGASDLRINGSALTDRVVVAGGGGGGCTCSAQPYAGGTGGGLVGGTPATCLAPTTVATGGTQTAGGIAGNYPNYGAAAPGVLGAGGAACTNTGGGGGGGGLYGGGGGSWMGGGGGSSFATTTATAVTHTQGFRAGNGVVTISW